MEDNEANPFLALADRVEAAEGPDRILFCKVIEALAGAVAYETQANFLRFVESEAWLDAAMTLVPDGMQWSFDSHYKMAVVSRYWDDPQHGPCRQESVGEGATAALSITAAALRARSAS